MFMDAQRTTLFSGLLFQKASDPTMYYFNEDLSVMVNLIKTEVWTELWIWCIVTPLLCSDLFANDTLTTFTIQKSDAKHFHIETQVWVIGISNNTTHNTDATPAQYVL